MTTTALVVGKATPKTEKSSGNKLGFSPDDIEKAPIPGGFRDTLSQLDTMTDIIAVSAPPTETVAETLTQPQALWDQTLPPSAFFAPNDKAWFDAHPNLISSVGTLETIISEVLMVGPQSQAKSHLPDAFPEANMMDVDVVASMKAIQKQSSMFKANAAPLPPISVMDEQTHFAPVTPDKSWLQNLAGRWPLALTAETGAPKRSTAHGKTEPPSNEIASARADVQRTAMENVSVEAEVFITRAEKNAAREKPAQSAIASIAPEAVQQEARLEGFAAAAYPSPGVQITSPILDELPAARTASIPSPDPAQAASKPALKTLRIALQPAGLGAVTITLSLKDQALSVGIEAEHEIAARALRVETQALTEKLSIAGYTVEALTILAAKSDASGAQQLGGESPAQSSFDKNDSGGREPGQKPQPGREGRAPQQGFADVNDRDTEKTDTRGGVYL
ncbi:MAG: flagellar hook-length control protein FliK [Hyphomicrobiales bacterium]|nr:flagellar hook-length control protein FliK [Hyphomicrobiales bacterium]